MSHTRSFFDSDQENETDRNETLDGTLTVSVLSASGQKSSIIYYHELASTSIFPFFNTFFFKYIFRAFLLRCFLICFHSPPITIFFFYYRSRKAPHLSPPKPNHFLLLFYSYSSFSFCSFHLPLVLSPFFLNSKRTIRPFNSTSLKNHFFPPFFWRVSFGNDRLSR